MRFICAKFCVTVDFRANMGRAFHASLEFLSGFYWLIWLFANVAYDTFHASAAGVYHVVGGERTVAFRSVRRFRGLRTRARVQFIAAMVFRNVNPYRARGQFTRLSSAWLLRRVFYRSFRDKGSVFLFGGARLAICLDGLELAIYAGVFVARALCGLRMAVGTKGRRRLLRYLQEL